MGLKDVLSRMKLIELSDPAAPAPGAGPSGGAASASAVPDLDQLLASLPAPKAAERKLAESVPPAGGPPASGEPSGDASALEIPDFAAIYRAAGIAEPAHGFSAFKVLEILSSPELAPLDGKAKAAALSGFLKMNPQGPVPIADVIQDAVHRDQALDRFESFLRGKLDTRAAEIERENAALQAEIDELGRKNRERMEANKRGLDAERARLEQWQASKQGEERRLFEAVASFVEQNPISTGPVPGGPAPRT